MVAAQGTWKPVMLGNGWKKITKKQNQNEAAKWEEDDISRRSSDPGMPPPRHWVNQFAE